MWGVKCSELSYTSDFFQGKEIPFEAEDVPARAWFRESFYIKDTDRVFEFNIPMKNYNLMLDEIQNCFANEKTLFSRHARMEMEIEEYGAILEKEVHEAIINGKIIENYPEDEPYPSCLV